MCKRLYVDEVELRKRHISRGAAYPEEDDLLKSCVELNKSIRELENAIGFDITHLGAENSARQIAEIICDQLEFQEPEMKEKD